MTRFWRPRLAATIRRLLHLAPLRHRPSWHTQLHRPEPQTRHTPDTEHSLNGGATWYDGWPPQWQQDEPEEEQDD